MMSISKIDGPCMLSRRNVRFNITSTAACFRTTELLLEQPKPASSYYSIGDDYSIPLEYSRKLNVSVLPTFRCQL